MLPEFSNLKLIESWDGDKAVTKAPSRQPTIREVMTHSSGFTYEFLDSDLKKYIDAEGLPSIFLQQRAGLLGQPLMFEPGSRWMYGTNIDIGGFIIEKVSSGAKPSLTVELERESLQVQASVIWLDSLANNPPLSGLRQNPRRISDREHLQAPRNARHVLWCAPGRPRAPSAGAPASARRKGHFGPDADAPGAKPGL